MEDDETPRIDDDDDDDDQVDLQMQELNELFSRFKTDPNDAFISVNQLAEVLQAFGRNPSIQDCEERIRELELEEKSELTLDDVLQILDEQWTMANTDRDVLRQAFAKFDETQEGYIDIEQFRTVMSTLGEPLTDDELEELTQLGLNEDQTKINIEYLLDQLLVHNA